MMSPVHLQQRANLQADLKIVAGAILEIFRLRSKTTHGYKIIFTLGRVVLRLLSFPVGTCDKSERDASTVWYIHGCHVTIMLAATSPLLHGVEKPVPVCVFFPMPPSHMCLPTSSPFCVPMFPSTAAYMYQSIRNGNAQVKSYVEVHVNERCMMGYPTC
jgi:hypothetical protein